MDLSAPAVAAAAGVSKALILAALAGIGVRAAGVAVSARLWRPVVAGAGAGLGLALASFPIVSRVA